MIDRLSYHYFNAGLENAKARMISAAVDNLWKSLSYDRSNNEAWKLLGLCCYRLGRLGTAEYCWTQCLYLHNGEADPSVYDYIKDVRMTAEKVRPYITAAFDLSTQKKYKKASTVFRKNVIPFLNCQADIFNCLGILYKQAGRKRKALREWKKALIIDYSGKTAAWYIACSERNGKDLL
ncbi:MAG: hypothetical protein Q7J78_00100 [Clostridiales bacterium]|nr:hypothetical protein [Clostridiales bacterium]